MSRYIEVRKTGQKHCRLYGPVWYKPWWTVRCILMDHLVCTERHKTREEADRVVDWFLYRSANTIWLLGRKDRCTTLKGHG